MCGIAGFEPKGAGDEQTVANLLESLAARGPDGAFAASHGGYQLVQSRLAVIDLSDRVRYPMLNETGDVALLFNGEIYNFRELRRQLEQHGHRFSSDCDAEVVVHGYEQWGTGVLSRLNGMFALALSDARTHELVLARDRLGIKPLVRTTRGRFAFASDVMSLVRAGLAAPRPDLAALRQYVTFHYVPPPLTGVEGTVALAPGTAIIRAADGSERRLRWAEPVFGHGDGAGEPDQALEPALRAAVADQLVADVDVGVLLSGGLDSALVLAYAVDAGAKPTAFTLSFPGSGDYDEAPAARRTAASLGVQHVVEPLALGFPDAVEAVGRAYDAPFGDASALATLAVARLARESVTVVLSGTGGDDLFAGYYRHRAHRLLPLVRMLPGRLRRSIGVAQVAAGSERSGRLRLARSYLGRVAAAGDGSPRAQYLGLVTQSAPARQPELLRFDADAGATATALADAHAFSGDNSSFLDSLQEFELATYLTGDLLVKEDRATMAVGLEGRVPLLDERVLAAASVLRDRDKLGLLAGKRPLRELAARRFGGRRSLHKRGFAVPLASLLGGSWSADARDWISATPSELVDTDRLAGVVAAGDAGPEAWSLICLVAWERRLHALTPGAP